MKELSKQEILAQLVGILEDMTSDWDFDYDGGIRSETRLIGDLSFESIEVVQLMVLIEGAITLRQVPGDAPAAAPARRIAELLVDQALAASGT